MADVKRGELTSSHERVMSREITSLKMVAGSIYIPKKNKEKPIGDDAHFICEEEGTIGVADGVGGWAKRGVDAGEYARLFINRCTIAIKNEPEGAVDLMRIMKKAYSNTMVKGSSTACIITLRDNTLHAVNVGDSGFMVIRDGKAIYQSPIQQHEFNCPYQLGIREDRPSSAQKLEVKVKAGDIIVAGTDGLLDNMFPTEIEKIIAHSNKQGLMDQPQELACTIATLALYNSFDIFTDTPFSIAARKANQIHKGGKVDDITVIVAYISN